MVCAVDAYEMFCCDSRVKAHPMQTLLKMMKWHWHESTYHQLQYLLGYKTVSDELNIWRKLKIPWVAAKNTSDVNAIVRVWISVAALHYQRIRHKCEVQKWSVILHSPIIHLHESQSKPRYSPWWLALVRSRIFVDQNCYGILNRQPDSIEAVNREGMSAHASWVDEWGTYL